MTILSWNECMSLGWSLFILGRFTFDVSSSRMPPLRRAVIDVGTNSIKLLVAEVTENNVQPLLEESQQTRLGRGFYEKQYLQPEAIEQTAQAVADFAKQAREMNASSTRVIATSAARDANNQQDLVQAISQASGL